jgi:hypothetical protein
MSEWQPIETAPRDGTEVLVYSAFSNTVQQCSWSCCAGAWCPISGWILTQWVEFGDYPTLMPCLVTATHWMPLPAAPM